jgi:hypothetical protein
MPDGLLLIAIAAINSGNVGIGTTGSVYKPHVIGDIGTNQPYAFKLVNG